MTALRGNPLDPRIIERLSKLLGMLGSSFDGERAAAAATDLGMMWTELLQSVASPDPGPERIEVNTDDLNLALANPEALTEWEQDFVRSIARNYSTLTAKQAACLARIASKARAYREGA
jgi:hypothetical protein